MSSDDKRKRPHAATIGVATRFQKGKSGNVGYDNKSHSIRGAMRWMAAQPLDLENLDEDLAKLIRKRGKKKHDAARAVAVRAFEKLLKKMEPRMLEIVIDNVDGKLIQPVTEVPLNAEAPESFDTLEEATEAWQQFNKS